MLGEDAKLLVEQTRGEKTILNYTIKAKDSTGKWEIFLGCKKSSGKHWESCREIELYFIRVFEYCLDKYKFAVFKDDTIHKRIFN